MLFKKIVLFSFLFPAPALVPLVSHAQETASTTESSQVVAEINQTKITKDQLRENLRQHLRSQLAYFRENDHHILLKQTLDKMVERELLLQAAKKEQLLPSDEELGAFVARLQQDLPRGETLEDMLNQRKLEKEVFLNGIREDLAIENYMRTEIYDSIELNDKQLEQVFKANPDAFTFPEEVRARHILVKLPKDATQKDIEQAQKEIDKIRQLALVEGSDFADLAEKYSQGPSSAKGGDLGYFTSNQMVEPFSKAAFALKPGEVSEVVRTRFGFHVIKLEDRRGGGKPQFSDVKDQVRQKVLQEKQQQALERHLKDLRAKNKVIVYYD